MKFNQIRGPYSWSYFSPAQIPRGRNLPGRQLGDSRVRFAPLSFPVHWQSTTDQYLSSPTLSWEGAVLGERSWEAPSSSFIVLLAWTQPCPLFVSVVHRITWFLRFSTSPKSLLGTAVRLFLFSFFPVPTGQPQEQRWVREEGLAPPTLWTDCSEWSE